MAEANAWAVVAGVAALLAAPCAHAECTVSFDADAAPVHLSLKTQADATAVVSMSLVPKLLNLDYASATAKRPSCDLGAVASAAGPYEMYGEDGAGGRTRKALPSRDGGAVAVIIPVVDILQAAEASKAGRPAPVSGYLLATVTQSDVIGWLYYSGLPEPSALKRDVTQVLSGALTPIFRNAPGGKTYLGLPKR